MRNGTEWSDEEACRQRCRGVHSRRHWMGWRLHNRTTDGMGDGMDGQDDPGKAGKNQTVSRKDGSLSFASFLAFSVLGYAIGDFIWWMWLR